MNVKRWIAVAVLTVSVLAAEWSGVLGMLQVRAAVDSEIEDAGSKLRKSALTANTVVLSAENGAMPAADAVDAIPIAGSVQIAGSMWEGQTLTADVSDVTPEEARETLSYAWTYEGESTVLGTGDSYTLRHEDVGKKIRLTVTASGLYTGSLSVNGTQNVKSDMISVTVNLTKDNAAWSGAKVLLCQNVSSPTVYYTLDDQGGGKYGLNISREDEHAEEIWFVFVKDTHYIYLLGSSYINLNNGYTNVKINQKEKNESYQCNFDYFVFKYALDGATGVLPSPSTRIMLSGSEFKVDTKLGLQKPYQVQTGWSMTAGGNGTPIDKVTNLNNTMILYPVFAHKEVTVTVNLTKDDAFWSGQKVTIRSENSQTQDLYTMTETDAGYSYTLKQDGQIYYVFVNGMCAGSFTAADLETQTVNCAGYGIQYVKNGGTIDRESQYTCYYKGAGMTLPTPVSSTAGYLFGGWYTNASFTGSAVRTISASDEGSKTYYAKWIPNPNIAYKVEHYQQNMSGSSYTLKETDHLTGTVDESVTAVAKSYTGFHVNMTHDQAVDSGTVAGDGSLTLKLYYDRDLYTVSYHLNGASGNVPAAQTLRYGSLLGEVSAPVRRGYVFKGWYKDMAGSASQAWDPNKTVEQNTTAKSVTLYAKWTDETAPVLGNASYNEGHRNLWNWIIRKKNLIITVPVTEEGSGVDSAVYTMIPATGSGQTRKAAQIEDQGGQTVVKITIAEDYKGALTLSCRDRVGNSSGDKTLTASGGGVIVEDNAPAIIFTAERGKVSDWFEETATIKINVKDDVDAAGKSKVSGGIASVVYQVDGGTPTSVSGKGFDSSLVASCDFTVDLSELGEHVISVTARDHADNTNIQQVTVRIREPHVHDYSTEWMCNAKNHWHECACGDKTGVAAHQWNNGVITRKPDARTAGIRTYTCKICKMKRDESIPALAGGSSGSSDSSSSGASGGGNSSGLSGGAAVSGGNKGGTPEEGLSKANDGFAGQKGADGASVKQLPAELKDGKIVIAGNGMPVEMDGTVDDAAPGAAGDAGTGTSAAEVGMYDSGRHR